MIDPVVRDDLLRADEEGRKARRQQWIQERAEDLLDEPDEVQDLLACYDFNVSGYWLARLLVDVMKRDPDTWSQAERKVYEWLLDEAAYEVEARMRDGE